MPAPQAFLVMMPAMLLTLNAPLIIDACEDTAELGIVAGVFMLLALCAVVAAPTPRAHLAYYTMAFGLGLPGAAGALMDPATTCAARDRQIVCVLNLLLAGISMGCLPRAWQAATAGPAAEAPPAYTEKAAPGPLLPLVQPCAAAETKTLLTGLLETV